MKYIIRWSQLQGPTTDDLKEFWQDLANAVVTLVVLFGSIAWLVWAIFPHRV